jgi:hypothetical protein
MAEEFAEKEIYREVRVVFSEEAYREMEEAASRRRTSIPELILDAIALQKWFDDRMAKKETILVESAGKLERVVTVRPSDQMREESRKLRESVRESGQGESNVADAY